MVIRQAMATERMRIRFVWRIGTKSSFDSYKICGNDLMDCRRTTNDTPEMLSGLLNFLENVEYWSSNDMDIKAMVAKLGGIDSGRAGYQGTQSENGINRTYYKNSANLAMINVTCNKG